MMEITVGKFYERERGINDCWTVTPVKVTGRIVYFRDLQHFDREIHNCSKQYFIHTFREMKSET